MLCLKRKIGEQVIVTHQGQELLIKVVEVRGDQVRLGFEGPQQFRIWRAEIERFVNDKSK